MTYKMTNDQILMSKECPNDQMSNQVRAIRDVRMAKLGIRH
jgi:hypothetical protein